MDVSSSDKKSNRLPMIGLFAVFIVPLIIAVVIYVYRDQMPIPGAKTEGELIRPARPVITFVEHGSPLEQLGTKAYKGKWTLTLYVQGKCDLSCEAALFMLRQVRIATGKNIGRVRRLALVQGTEIDAHTQRLLDRYPRMGVARIDQLDFDNSGQEPLQLIPGEVYIVDPLGNFMMRYDNTLTAKGLLKDLKKLLKVSQVG